MEPKLTVTTETATGDANGLAKVLGQLVRHYPYLQEGVIDGKFQDLKPYTIKRLKNVLDDRAKIEAILPKYFQMIEDIVAEASADA